MPTSLPLRPFRAALVVGAVLAVSACSFELSGPSEGEAEGAGRDYGQTLADTIGARTTDKELEALCGKGAVEEGIVTEGREGDETDNELDAFIAACREAVSAE